MTLKQHKKLMRFPGWLKILALLFVMLVFFVGKIGMSYYNDIYRPNVNLGDKQYELLFVPENATFEELTNLLDKYGLVEDKESFVWVAKIKKLPHHMHPGRYKIQNGWSNNQLINLLRSGQQSPVKVTFNNIRTIPELAGRLSQQVMADSSELASLLQDSKYLKNFGVTPPTASCLFIPNTYELYWNTNADKLIRRMHKEYKRFWSEKRKTRATEIGFSPLEVMTLASIIDEETNIKKEKNTIAGLYINRLNRGIPLQACPTLKFAINDFSLKRVLNKHKEIESPYNTYKNQGLPPGPIRVPSIEAIEAVLNYEKHDFLYMCAKDDFSGYHYFSKTLSEHNRYARRYHNQLNKRKIYK